MYKKVLLAACILIFLFMTGPVGCARKSVRHLASDVIMVTPGSSKQDVVTYLGQPDEEYKSAAGSTLWVYYEARKDVLRDTPYIGDKIGEESYEIVRVTFNGETVQDVDFRTMTEEDFKSTRPAE